MALKEKVVIDKIVARGITGFLQLSKVYADGEKKTVCANGSDKAGFIMRYCCAGIVPVLLAPVGLKFLISKIITTYGIEKIVRDVVKGLKKKGITTLQIKSAVDNHPKLSAPVKQKIAGMLIDLS